MSRCPALSFPVQIAAAPPGVQATFTPLQAFTDPDWLHPHLLVCGGDAGARAALGEALRSQARWAGWDVLAVCDSPAGCDESASPPPCLNPLAWPAVRFPPSRDGILVGSPRVATLVEHCAVLLAVPPQPVRRFSDLERGIVQYALATLFTDLPDDPDPDQVPTLRDLMCLLRSYQSGTADALVRDLEWACAESEGYLTTEQHDAAAWDIRTPERVFDLGAVPAAVRPLFVAHTLVRWLAAMWGRTWSVQQPTLLLVEDLAEVRCLPSSLEVLRTIARSARLHNLRLVLVDAVPTPVPSPAEWALRDSAISLTLRQDAPALVRKPALTAAPTPAAAPAEGGGR